MITPKAYALLTSAIFALVAILHLTRLVTSWDLVIGSWHVPTLVSVVGSIVPGVLAVQGFRIGRKESGSPE